MHERETAAEVKHPRVPIDVQRGYDRWSDAYDVFENPMVALTSIAFDTIAPPLTDGTVLDLGCGTGRLLQRVLERDAAFGLGIDGSTGMLERARTRLKRFEDRVLLVADALGGPWPTRPEVRGRLPADGVCVTLVLEHFEDPRVVLDRAAQGVRPGGWLFLAELHADLYDAGTGAHFESEGVCYTLPSHRHTTSSLREALQRAGFVTERLLEMRACDYVAAVPKLARHGTRNALCAILARRVVRVELSSNLR